jgi:hypothetical protein
MTKLDSGLGNLQPVTPFQIFSRGCAVVSQSVSQASIMGSPPATTFDHVTRISIRLPAHVS